MKLNIDTHVITINSKGNHWKLPENSLVLDNENKIGTVIGVMVDAFGYMMQKIAYNSLSINYHIIDDNGERLLFTEENCNYYGFNFLGEYPR